MNIVLGMQLGCCMSHHLLMTAAAYQYDCPSCCACTIEHLQWASSALVVDVCLILQGIQAKLCRSICLQSVLCCHAAQLLLGHIYHLSILSYWQDYEQCTVGRSCKSDRHTRALAQLFKGKFDVLPKFNACARTHRLHTVFVIREQVKLS